MLQIITTQSAVLGQFVLVVAGGLAFFLLGNSLVYRVFSRSDGPRGSSRAAMIRPWLFMLPALSMLAIFLVFPLVQTLWLSLHGRSGNWVGGDNYIWLAGNGKFRESVVNNALWLVIVPAASSLLGLVAAGLTDRLCWGRIAQSLIFMPMAISFVGAAVIWKFIYEYRGAGQGDQIGLLNAVVDALGIAPQPWLLLPFWNSFFLMVILIWIQTGFAMVILLAALKSIPEDICEAARLDGAGPVQIFLQIQVPQIWGPIAVVWTTITVIVLKVFDIVFAMTNGQWGTQVLANLMYDWMFRANDPGRGAAVAVVLMLLVTPVMIWNMRRISSRAKKQTNGQAHRRGKRQAQRGVQNQQAKQEPHI